MPGPVVIASWIVTVLPERLGAVRLVLDSIPGARVASHDEPSFYRLWHHEGRRARMGVSMQGPDYTQWHGFFEVAERFCFDFLPKAREAAHGDPEVARVIKTVLDSPEHSWLKGMSPEDRARIDAFYHERCGAEAAR